MLSATTPATTLPRPDHIVVVVLEDHSYQQIVGPPTYPSFTWWVVQPPPQIYDPYLRSLAKQSAVFSNMTGTAHYNQTDYQALFSGLRGQKNPHAPLIQNQAPNIASELIASGQTFAGYSEGLPSVGWSHGDVGDYTQAHNPWVDLKNVPPSASLPFSSFPHDFSAFPTVSYVIPNEYHNMHSGPVSASDKWMASNIQPYAAWARRHNSLLVVTWDESHDPKNNIPTFLYGPMIKPGTYAKPMNHYALLSTLEQMVGLAPTNEAANYAPVTDVFRDGGPIRT